MTIRCIVFKNFFGQHYLFSLGNTTFQQHIISPLIFFDQISTERFLRNIRQSKQNWLRLAKHLDRAPNTIHPIALLSKNILQGKILIYALPEDYESRSKSAPIYLSQRLNNDQFQIVPSVESLLMNEAKPVDIASSLEIIESLDLSDESLKALTQPLKNTDSEFHSDSPKKLKLALKKAISTGELVLLNLGTRSVPKKAKIIERIDTKPVPLAPEVKPWIQIKLIDENGDSIPVQKYWIKDVSGIEYEGTTDKKGVAHLSKIAEGDCEISFPELVEWY